MPNRIGSYTVETPNRPAILSYAAAVGKMEGEGPLGDGFDYIAEDTTLGESSWEQAESMLQKTAVQLALKKAAVTAGEVDMILPATCSTSASGRPLACGISESRW